MPETSCLVRHPPPTQLRKFEKRCESDELTHGALTDEKKARLEEAQKTHDKLWTNVAALADALDHEPPPPIQVRGEG